MLKEALSKNPSNIPVQLKLLSVYVSRKDVNSFSSIAHKVKDTGDATAWEQAAAMGRAVDPSNPMYAGVGGGATASAATEKFAESGAPSAMPALDMDIGFNIPMDLDVTAAAHVVEASSTPIMDFDVSGQAASSSMDFDVTGSHTNVTKSLLPDFDVTGSHANEVPAQRMDFDVTGSHDAVTETQHMDFDMTGSHDAVTETQHMDFDVTGSHPSVIASVTPEENMGTVVLDAPMDIDISAGSAGDGASSGLDFGVMDFNISDASPAASSVAGEISSGLVGMDFDISSSPSTANAAAKEALSGLDIGGTDFDISSSPSTTAATAGETLSFGGMDFDISASSPTATPAVGDASAGLSGMDFDISSPSLAQSSPAMDIGLGGISFDLDTASTVVSPVAEARKDERWQEVATKLDLARAYQEMGDTDGAREILGEVLNEGDEQQIEAARTLMQQL